MGTRFKKRVFYWVFAFTLPLMGCTHNIDKVIYDPIDSSTIPDRPSALNAEIGDGFIVLSWTVDDNTNIAEYRIYMADSSETDYRPVGSSGTESFTASGLTNGRLYSFEVSALDSDGYEGFRSDPIFASPGLFSVLINGGNEYTTSRNVTISLTAPAGTAVMQVSGDSTFSGSLWETYSNTRVFNLTSGDGTKTVYCRFRDSMNLLSSGFFRDDIILDTRAFIDSVVFAPLTPLSPGETVHFELHATETEGTSAITIEGIPDVIELFDDGQRGDASANDGIYEVDFVIPLSFDFEDKFVSGNFTDAAGNSAQTIQANNTLSVRKAPDGITVFSVNAPQGFHDRLAINWEGSSAADFAQYRVYRGMSTGVDSTDFLVASLVSRSSTTVTDTGLTENSTYYYKVYVVDFTGLWGGSNEVSGTTGMDTAPNPVNLYPVIVEPDAYQQVDLDWSESGENDFQSYRVYRWQEDIGRTDSALVAFITSRGTSQFTDEPPFNTSEDTVNFWYILYVYDNGGNYAASDSVKAHLVDNIPPQVSGTVAASDSSLIVTWSASTIPDFSGYRLLRNTASDTTGAITVFVAASSSTSSYEDESSVQGQTYYYWLDVNDLRGNRSRSLLGSGAW